MKICSIFLLLLTSASVYAGFPAPPATGTVSFDFKASTINGDGTLGTSFKTTVDGQATETEFDLSSIIAGLTLKVTPSQSDISNTASGLGITSGGTFDTAGDALIFQFNKAITLDFLDMGAFTGAGLASEDAVSIIYSNSNPTINLVGGDFDNNTSDTISFTSGNALPGNQAFTISYDDGDFTLEGFNISVVPEPGTYALLSGCCALGFVMRRRRN